jgi:hypothetical protein
MRSRLVCPSSSQLLEPVHDDDDDLGFTGRSLAFSNDRAPFQRPGPSNTAFMNNS